MLPGAEAEVWTGGAAFAFAFGFAVVVVVVLLIRELAGMIFEPRFLAPPPAAVMKDRVVLCFRLDLLVAIVRVLL
jgi:hypothetical protein